MSLLIAVWAVRSIVCQQFLESRRWSIPARFVWGTLDSVLLLAVLLVANGAASPLMVGYPLLIAASGLWFRVRFVWFITVLSLAVLRDRGAGFLPLASRSCGLDFDADVNRHVIFAVALVVLGLGGGVPGAAGAHL